MMDELLFDSGRIVLTDGQVQVYLDRKARLNDPLVLQRISVHLLLNVGHSHSHAVEYLVSEGYTRNVADNIVQLFNEWSSTYEDLVNAARML